MTGAGVRTRARLLEIAIALFGVLVGVAMVRYQGGSRFDPQQTYYEWGTNYLSDLGRAVTYAGRSNAMSRLLFAGATAFVGGALAWSAPAWRAWDGRGRAVAATDLMVLSSLLAGVGFAAVGVVPQDRLLGPHNFVVDAAFGLLLVFMASLTVVQWCNGAPRRLWVTNVVALAILAAYAVLVLGRGAPDPSALRFEIAAQKVAVGVALLDVALQARGLLGRVASTGSDRVGAGPALSGEGAA